MASGRMRVPRTTGRPDTLPGTLSMSSQAIQSMPETVSSFAIPSPSHTRILLLEWRVVTPISVKASGAYFACRPLLPSWGHTLRSHSVTLTLGGRPILTSKRAFRGGLRFATFAKRGSLFLQSLRFLLLTAVPSSKTSKIRRRIVRTYTLKLKLPIDKISVPR